MSRTPAQAIQAIRTHIARHTNIGSGMCQKNAHDVYGIGPRDASAYLAWLHAKYKHHDLDQAPVGAFVFMDGGHTIVDGHPAGHVLIKADEHGHFYTPGGPQDPDHWYVTTIAELRAGWPWHHVVGWTEDINGARVPGLAVSKPKPKRKPMPTFPGLLKDAEQAVWKAQHQASDPKMPRRWRLLHRALNTLRKINT